MPSYILAPDIVGRAVNAVLNVAFPNLEMQPNNRLLGLKRRALAVVVLDPTKTPVNTPSFEDAILYESYFGDMSTWERAFDEIARRKARLSWRTGLSSHLVQQRAPYLFENDDVKYGGSVVWEGGLIVAASGLQWYLDQMFSSWIAAAIQALCIQEMELWMEAPGDTFNNTRIVRQEGRGLPMETSGP